VITNVTNNVEEITQYQGAHATDPVARNDGTPLQTGDLYFNTVINELKVWTGTAWVPSSPGSITVQNFTGTGAQTAFNLASAPVAENNTQIYIDGVYQQKDTYTVSGATIDFSTAPPNLSGIEVVTFSIASLGTVDSSNVSYNQGSAGAVNTSVQAKLQESVSVQDFGAVGDGVTDDTAAIQAAINTASSVLFPSGTYKVLSTITLTSNLILKGDGGIVDASSIADGFVATGKSDVTVQNMEFILDTDANGGLFTIDGCHRVNFVNNYFRAEDDDDTGNNSAIRIREEVGVSGSRDVIITNNFFVGPRLLVLVQAGATYNNKNVVISNNVFKNDCVAVRSPNILDGIVKIDLWSDDVTVSGNVCDGDQKVESFIQIEEGITNCTVTGNTIKDCTEYGINISGGQGPLDVTEVSITGNTLKNCSLGVEGLHTNSGEWIISNNVISGASIDASTPGIDLEFANAGANVIISNNLVNSPAEEGIYCKADGATITGNNVTGATGVSIYVYDADNSSVIGNNVSQSNNTPYPIYIRSSDLCNIVGNSVKGAATVTSGIAFVGCSGGFAQGNYVSMANSTYGILVDGTSSDIAVLSNSASVSTQALSVPVAANHRFGNIDIGAAVHSVADIGGEFIWADSAGNLRIKGSSPVSDTDGTVVGTQT
jgi:parallel beta-helix repeat protein